MIYSFFSSSRPRHWGQWAWPWKLRAHYYHHYHSTAYSATGRGEHRRRCWHSRWLPLSDCSSYATCSCAHLGILRQHVNSIPWPEMCTTLRTLLSCSVFVSTAQTKSISHCMYLRQHLSKSVTPYLMYIHWWITCNSFSGKVNIWGLLFGNEFIMGSIYLMYVNLYYIWPCRWVLA